MTVWGTLNLSSLTELEDSDSKIKQIEWDAYFIWYLRASKHIQDSKIASL